MVMFDVTCSATSEDQAQMAKLSCILFLLFLFEKRGSSVFQRVGKKAL